MGYDFAMHASVCLTERLHAIEDERESFDNINNTFLEAFEQDSALPKPKRIRCDRNGLLLVWEGVDVFVTENSVRVQEMLPADAAEVQLMSVTFTAPYNARAIEGEILCRIKPVRESTNTRLCVLLELLNQTHPNVPPPNIVNEDGNQSRASWTNLHIAVCVRDEGVNVYCGRGARLFSVCDDKQKIVDQLALHFQQKGF